MLQIYWIDDPEPLSENLYLAALKNGEVRYRDLNNIFDMTLGIGYYTDHFLNLALRLRLLDEVIDDQYYILSDQTADAIRQMDPGEQLFDILTRLPHFARWVQLTASDGHNNIEYKDVVPSGEREYKMRQGRVEQFESWAEKINKLAEDTTFNAIQSEYERQSAYIWEDYISFSDIEADLDPALLLSLLGGAANCGASCKTSRLVDLLESGREEFDTIVNDIFTPVGVPLHRTSTSLGLALPTELRVDDRTTLWDELSELLGDIEISSLEHLTDYMQYETNILDFVDTPRNPTPRFTVVDGLHESVDTSREKNMNHTTCFDTIEPAENAAFVAIPPHASEVTTQDLFDRIEEVLETVKDGRNAPGQHSPFEYHVREQIYHLGSIPLLKAPDFEALTTVGEQYLRRNTNERRSLVFDHMIARNPPARTIIAAVDVDHFTMEQLGESWVIRAGHDEIHVQSVLERHSEYYGLTVIGIDSKDPITQIVSYLRTTGILKGQGAVNRLQISSAIDEHLKQNPRGTRQLFDQTKDRVQGIVGEIR